MARKRTIPRTCVVCRTQQDKRQLTRLVRTNDGIYIDPKGTMNGRGAYLCDRVQCWQKAATTGILDKALRTTVTDADRQRIRQYSP